MLAPRTCTALCRALGADVRREISVFDAAKEKSTASQMMTSRRVARNGEASEKAELLPATAAALLHSANG